MLFALLKLLKHPITIRCYRLPVLLIGCEVLLISFHLLLLSLLLLICLRKVILEVYLAKTNEKKEAEEKKMEGNKKDLASNEEYRKSITPDCDWMLEKFEERKKHRKVEMDGLVQAKEFLAGANPGGFVETEMKFDDNRFGEIN